MYLLNSENEYTIAHIQYKIATIADCIKVVVGKIQL